ncbi:hypothetical protein [Sphingobacterium sp. LRF_L2]|uniref:hypothetical protein n=1 Tax=Sphingobacterium sp. LRF_L2 TaxID=3369421 RepID=UPI003F5F73FB
MRNHKRSICNCKYYIPELITDLAIEEVTNHPDVIEGIHESYGRSLNVFVYDLNTGESQLTVVTKSKAI